MGWPRRGAGTMAACSHTFASTHASRCCCPGVWPPTCDYWTAPTHLQCPQPVAGPCPASRARRARVKDGRATAAQSGAIQTRSYVGGARLQTPVTWPLPSLHSRVVGYGGRHTQTTHLVHRIRLGHVPFEAHDAKLRLARAWWACQAGEECGKAGHSRPRATHGQWVARRCNQAGPASMSTARHSHSACGAHRARWL